ncbi:hypothetical protein EDD85DRAFT_792751 [Armillaria nabsnona]|nr:hypothetical protein EDD85DRAFT_792751 [Armillaria nabsnona]
MVGHTSKAQIIGEIFILFFSLLLPLSIHQDVYNLPGHFSEVDAPRASACVTRVQWKGTCRCPGSEGGGWDGFWPKTTYRLPASKVLMSARRAFPTSVADPHPLLCSPSSRAIYVSFCYDYHVKRQAAYAWGGRGHDAIGVVECFQDAEAAWLEIDDLCAAATSRRPASMMRWRVGVSKSAKLRNKQMSPKTMNMTCLTPNEAQNRSQPPDGFL